jgi:hypothetical protein
VQIHTQFEVVDPKQEVYHYLLSIVMLISLDSLLEYEINWWVDKNKSVGLKGFNEKKRVNGCFVKMEGEPTLMIVTEIKLTFHGKKIYLPTEF